jgi:hypothetical protein
VDSIIFGLTLTGALVGFEPNENGRKAATYSARASYYQSGYNKVIEPILSDLDRRYIPDSFRKFGVGVSFIYRLAKDNKIEYSWSF